MKNLQLNTLFRRGLQVLYRKNLQSAIIDLPISVRLSHGVPSIKHQTYQLRCHFHIRALQPVIPLD